jgi:hypothetical protein
MPKIRARSNRKGIARIVFYVVRTMPIARQQVAKHIPAEVNVQNNRRFTARQWCDKQALSTKQAVFSMGSMQSGYKRVKFQSWQFRKNENEN